jgi:hypothetical protein
MIKFPTSPVSENCADRREQCEGEDPAKEPPQEHTSVGQRALMDAIERGQIGFEGLNAVRPLLLHLFARIERLGGQIDQAFGGQAFFLNLPPLCPANRRRFHAYLECHCKMTRLLGEAIELWMLTCGVQRVPIQPAARRRRLRSR